MREARRAIDAAARRSHAAALQRRADVGAAAKRRKRHATDGGGANPNRGRRRRTATPFVAATASPARRPLRKATAGNSGFSSPLRTTVPRARLERTCFVACPRRSMLRYRHSSQAAFGGDPTPPRLRADSAGNARRLAPSAHSNASHRKDDA